MLTGCSEVEPVSLKPQRKTLPTQPSLLGLWEVTVVIDEEATRAYLREEGLSGELVDGELAGLRHELSQTRLTAVFRPDGTMTSETRNADGTVTKNTEGWDVLETAEHSLVLKITQPEVERAVKIRFLNPDYFEITEKHASLVQVLKFERQTGKVSSR